MRSYKTEGIIIKRRNSGEADRVLTIFTKYQGKITAKGKGVRKITSRRSGHIELLNHSVFTLHQGRSFPIVTEAQTVENFSLIKSDLKKVGFAYHLCELIDGLCADSQENSLVFSLFQNTLHKLCLQEDILAVIHEFEIELLTLLGFYKPQQLAFVEDTSYLIENILERRLRSKRFIAKIQ